jgi:hypothetical protein
MEHIAYLLADFAPGHVNWRTHDNGLDSLLKREKQTSELKLRQMIDQSTSSCLL